MRAVRFRGGCERRLVSAAREENSYFACFYFEMRCMNRKVGKFTSFFSAFSRMIFLYKKLVCAHFESECSPFDELDPALFRDHGYFLSVSCIVASNIHPLWNDGTPRLAFWGWHPWSDVLMVTSSEWLPLSGILGVTSSRGFHLRSGLGTSVLEPERFLLDLRLSLPLSLVFFTFLILTMTPSH